MRLDSIEDLDAKTERMKERGVEPIFRIDHGWCTSIYANDPNGILVEYCVTTDESAFAQSEEEALRLLRQPRDEIREDQRK